VRPGPGLGGDDRDVAASAGGVGEPGREQRALDAPAAVPGRGGRTRELRDAAAAHDVTLHWAAEAPVAPVELDPRVRSVIDARARGLGLSAVAMPSGAGHDAQNMATLAPTGMIFIPSRDGRSHSPAEHTDWADIENGANVLLATLTDLATTGLGQM
jgi:acetylornithine deacetylase/succinyl-diaminopimelate desuccinylase-like protein